MEKSCLLSLSLWMQNEWSTYVRYKQAHKLIKAMCWSGVEWKYFAVGQTLKIEEKQEMIIKLKFTFKY